MVTEIRIYFEGDRRLRSGFDAFFATLRDRAREKRCSFHLIAAQGNPGRDFRIAIKTHPDAWNILLKDSEGPDSGALSSSLCEHNKWDKSQAESIFWMVEMMESWFHADKDALERFYGPGREFRRNALKANPNVEQISKKDLEDGLSAATKGTSKGDYYDHKTSHGPALLASIDPDLVKGSAPHCKKLFQAVLAKLT
jgi:hypothetical protein